MSNASIVERILDSVASFEAGSSSASLVNSSIEVHSPGFEGSPRTLTDRLNELGLKLLREDLSEFESEQLGWPNETRETICQIKETLRAIATLA